MSCVPFLFLGQWECASLGGYQRTSDKNRGKGGVKSQGFGDGHEKVAMGISSDIKGPAKNIGVDNGDPLDLASTKINQRKAFHGKCLMILQSQQESGTVTVEATADGLESALVEIRVSGQ